MISTQKVIEDFAMMGVQIAEQEQEEPSNIIEVWAINWPILDVFLALETQWRAVVAGGGMAAPRLVYLGLDYSAVDVVLRRFGFGNDDRDILDHIKHMELAALGVQDEVY